MYPLPRARGHQEYQGCDGWGSMVTIAAKDGEATRGSEVVVEPTSLMDEGITVYAWKMKKVKVSKTSEQVYESEILNSKVS